MKSVYLLVFLLLVACKSQVEPKQYRRAGDLEPKTSQSEGSKQSEDDSFEKPESGEELLEDQSDDSPDEKDSDNQDFQENDADNEALTFAAVQPVLEKSCGGGGCHSPGAPFRDYVSNDEQLKSRKSEVLDEVDARKSMPPRNRQISDEDRKTVVDFVNQL